MGAPLACKMQRGPDENPRAMHQGRETVERRAPALQAASPLTGGEDMSRVLNRLLLVPVDQVANRSEAMTHRGPIEAVSLSSTSWPIHEPTASIVTVGTADIFI
jgi:hypothetical protein